MDGNNIVYTVVIRPEDHMIYGADNIGKIIKRHPRDIQGLVETGTLKAWKDGEKGKWRALCADLLQFNSEEKKRYCNRCQ